MTAEIAGKAAIESAWSTLRRMREQWLLILFLTGALLWARDTYDEFAKLPPLVRQQMSGLAELRETVMRLEDQVKRRLLGDRTPVLEFPGTRHGIADSVPGQWTILSWRPVRRLRDDCVPKGLDAWIVDRRGQWFSVETAVSSLPALRDEVNLSFGVLVDPAVSEGRAKLTAQIVFDCGTHRQVQTAPWLQFRVIGD